MNILSFFVIIPLLMLGALWTARNINQVRGVMVAGSSLLLALSVYLTFDYIALRQGGATAEMLYTASTPLVRTFAHSLFRWCRRNLRSYDFIECHHRIYRYFCFLETTTDD